MRGEEPQSSPSSSASTTTPHTVPPSQLPVLPFPPWLSALGRLMAPDSTALFLTTRWPPASGGPSLRGYDATPASPPPAGGCVAPSSCSTSHRVTLPAPMGRGTRTTNTASGTVELGSLGMCPRKAASTVMDLAARVQGHEGAAERVTGAGRSPHGTAALAHPLCWLNTPVPACQPSSLACPTLLPSSSSSVSKAAPNTLYLCFAILASSSLRPVQACSILLLKMEGVQCSHTLCPSLLLFFACWPSPAGSRICRASSRFTLDSVDPQDGWNMNLVSGATPAPGERSWKMVSFSVQILSGTKPVQWGQCRSRSPPGAA